jgi:hypothetical protein
MSFESKRRAEDKKKRDKNRKERFAAAWAANKKEDENVEKGTHEEPAKAA